MVYAVGKINDIFVGQGITDYVYTVDNMDGVDKTIAAIREQKQARVDLHQPGRF